MSHSRCVDSHALKSASPPSSKLWQSSKSEKALLYSSQESFSGAAAVLRPCRAVSHLLGSLRIFYWHSNLALFLYAALFIVLCRGGSYVGSWCFGRTRFAFDHLGLVFGSATSGMFVSSVFSSSDGTAPIPVLAVFGIWGAKCSSDWVRVPTPPPTELICVTCRCDRVRRDLLLKVRVPFFAFCSTWSLFRLLWYRHWVVYLCLCACRLRNGYWDGYWAGSWSDAGGIVDDLPSLFM